MIKQEKIIHQKDELAIDECTFSTKAQSKYFEGFFNYRMKIGQMGKPTHEANRSKSKHMKQIVQAKLCLAYKWLPC